MILFDFDGTLVDSFEVGYQCVLGLKEEYGLNHLTRDRFRQLSMRQALDEAGLKKHRLPGFAIRLKKEVRKRLGELKLFPGIHEMVRGLKSQDLELAVLSSNSEENIRDLLKREGIEDDFDHIVSDSSLFGKGKVIRRLLERLGRLSRDVIYVGDEVRDFEGCQKAGVRMIGVTWGYDHIDLLRPLELVGLYSSPDELLRALTERN